MKGKKWLVKWKKRSIESEVFYWEEIVKFQTGYQQNEKCCLLCAVKGHSVLLFQFFIVLASNGLLLFKQDRLPHLAGLELFILLLAQLEVRLLEIRMAQDFLQGELGFPLVFLFSLAWVWLVGRLHVLLKIWKKSFNYSKKPDKKRVKLAIKIRIRN